MLRVNLNRLSLHKFYSRTYSLERVKFAYTARNICIYGPPGFSRFLALCLRWVKTGGYRTATETAGSPQSADFMLWLIAVIGTLQPGGADGKSRPAVRAKPAGRGARKHAPGPADIQVSGDELAVAWEARDSLADNGSQLLMPSRRDLLCGGASQKRLDRFKSLLLGRAGFDRDCQLGKMVGEGHAWGLPVGWNHTWVNRP